MNILVVDDDPIAGEISQAIIEGEGHETLLAKDAEEATALIASHPEISVVVSDHHMPGTSGVGLYRRLMAEGIRMPFILLSGDEPASLQDLARGIDAVLAKDGSLGSELPAALGRLPASAREGRQA